MNCKGNIFPPPAQSFKNIVAIFLQIQADFKQYRKAQFFRAGSFNMKDNVKADMLRTVFDAMPLIQ